jgi:hypothetical protein
MLLETLPLAQNIDVDKLSDIEDICGRDIKNAVIKAAIVTAIEKKKTIGQETLTDAINGIILSNKEMDEDSNSTPLSEEEKKTIGAKITAKLKEQEAEKNKAGKENLL